VQYHALVIAQVIRVIQDFSNPIHDSFVPGLLEHLQGEVMMHDLLIALAFIGMIVAPAVVAAKTDINIPDKTE
jgi:hypothetical protein